MGSRTWHWPGVLLGLLLATAGAQADTLRVATLDWAPYGAAIASSPPSCCATAPAWAGRWSTRG